MYEISFFQAKNGSETCKINQTLLHSAYNPELEAERFASSSDADFIPSAVFVIEPALSYCGKPLKKKFPGTEIYSIRFSKDFIGYGKDFSKSFFFKTENPSGFENEIYRFFDDKTLCSALFLEWPPSAKIFKPETESLLKSVRKIIEKAKASLVTESFFAKRWLKNAFLFSMNLKKTSLIERGNFPVVICASGPSLYPSIKKLKKFREKYFLAAASSSVSVLLENGIEPDIALSTDGGFWAKNHLVYDLKKHGFPVALTCEGAFPKKLMREGKIIPLLYRDGLASSFSEKVLSSLDIPFLSAERNGTVSGTLLSLSMNLTEAKIFACGLDLESGKGKQHSEPNRNENFSRRNETKTEPRETKNARERLNSKSLELYRNWFQNLPENYSAKFFRLSDNWIFEHNLGKIKDINFTDFEDYLESLDFSKLKKIAVKDSKEISENEKDKIRNQIENFLHKFENEPEGASLDSFSENLFPAETVLLRKLKDESEKKIIAEKILERKKDFLESVRKILGKEK